MQNAAHKTALITGVSGQDGSYLAEYLLAKGVRVVGTAREGAAAAARLPAALSEAIAVEPWDLIDKPRFADLLAQYRPNQIYNLAAFSSGEHMDRHPERVCDINGIAVLRMLEAIRAHDPAIRFCQASSSEVFAGAAISPQSEATPRQPRSIYGAAKILADQVIVLHRQKYGLFCCSAFLFNHESPRRGAGFVTTKIVRAAVAISQGRQDKLLLGNLAALRDWGFAGDYVRAMALMLEADQPADYVIATGQVHTVADFCDHAFRAVDLDYRDFVEVHPDFYRPVEATTIIGDTTRVRAALDWQPQVSLPELVVAMVDAEREASRSQH